MKAITLFFLCLLFTFTANSGAQAQETVSVNRVKSGTTFTTTSGETIELLGVKETDSELITSGDARKFLELMLGGNEVSLVADADISDPETGPKPRYVYLADGRLVNMRMIAAGYGSPVLWPLHDMSEEFTGAERIMMALDSGNLASALSPENILSEALQELLPNALSELMDKIGGTGGGEKGGKPKSGKTKSSKSSKQKSIKKESSETSESEGSRSTSVQCSGTTKKGARCRNMTTSSSGRCYHHD